MVNAVVPSGKAKGFHTGKLIIRARPSYKVGSVDGIHPKNVMLRQRSDGYAYAT
jgi:hypothetical protein